MQNIKYFTSFYRAVLFFCPKRCQIKFNTLFGYENKQQNRIKKNITTDHSADIDYNYFKKIYRACTKDPSGKYWCPGRLEDVPLQRPQDIPQRSYLTVPGMSLSDVPGTSWSNVLGTFWNDVQGGVLIWSSRDVPGRLIRDVPRTFSGRPLEDLQSTQTWMFQHFL